MESVAFLEKISIDPPLEKIYQRLGHKKRTTEVSVRGKKETDFFINEAFSLIFLRGMFLRLAINNNDGEEIILSGNLIFHSKKLSFFSAQLQRNYPYGSDRRQCRHGSNKGKSQS